MKENEIPVCLVKDYLPLGAMKFYEGNPRTIQPNRLIDLKNSIVSKGFYKPILIWKKNKSTLEGNHRVIACRELVEEGYEFVSPSGEKNVLPIVYEDCSKDEAEQILYESNNSYAEWIEEKLSAAMREAEEAGKDLRAYGFSQDQIDTMLTVATKEAEDSVEGGEEDEPREGSDTEVDDDYETLVLPRTAYEPLLELLSRIAVSLNPDWEEGDSLEEATLHLVTLGNNNFSTKTKKKKVEK